MRPINKSDTPPVVSHKNSNSADVNFIVELKASTILTLGLPMDSEKLGNKDLLSEFGIIIIPEKITQAALKFPYVNPSIIIAAIIL